MKIALANLSFPRNREESVELATTAIADAGRLGASIVCFPECYVPGYRLGGPDDAPVDAAFQEAAWTQVSAAAKSANTAVILGTERVEEGRPIPSVLVFNADGSQQGFQDKVQLDPSEDTIYVPGNGRRVFRCGPMTFGVVICHEGWRYPETVRWAVRNGAQVVFHPHVTPVEPGAFVPGEFCDTRNTFHEKAMLCRAAENTCWFASVNCMIPGSGTTSAVIRPDATVHAWQPYGQSGLLIADIDLSLATALLARRLKPTDGMT